MRRTLTTLLLASLALAMTVAANKRTTVTQVKEAVTLTDDVDYVVTSATPFAEEGSIDIVNTDHATVILNAVKPSAAIKLLAAYVKINGQKAVNNTNCQVKIYNRGALILPYPNRQMLTVYSEPDFGGTAVSDFGTENSGGFMNTLTEAKLNNRIRSFRLKRGYMVTFSTLPKGRGYSRCFIAANEDLEMATLPDVLDGRISSYRVFRWNDTGKQALANDTRAESVNALNVTSCYSFGLGEDRGVDCECVPHHIYEDWPSAAACGGVNYSPHMKTNNEPRNSADDHPQDLATILANWENLMATGMRLCSPSSWDGSDYWNGTGFLKEFFDSIDARGWRCDIVDLHGYWAEGSFSTNIPNWYNAVKRPVWVSEWCWGASWNNNGAFASGVTQAQVKAAMQRICGVMNGQAYVERYYFWNSERDISKVYASGKLTPAGEYYATINSGVGYSGKYDFVPTTPRQYAPSAFAVSYADGTATIKWHDQNGEYNRLMQVERKLKGGQWELLATPEQKEQAANYTYKDENAPEGAQYRLHLVDLDGNSYYTNNDMAPGDAVTIDGETRYVGGNLVTNGDFDLGTQEWTAGTGAPVGQPYFQAVPVGGIDGGSYLQAYGSAAVNTVQSVKRYVAVQPNTSYIFRCASRNGGSNQQLYLSPDGKATGTLVGRLKNTDNWSMQELTFNSGESGYALIAFNTLQAKAQFDKIELRPLFGTRQEAVADGVEKLRQEAKAVMAFNAAPGLAALNDELQQRLDAIVTADDDALAEAQKAVGDLLQGVADRAAIDSLATVYDALVAAGVNVPALEEILPVSAADYHRRRAELQQAIDLVLDYTAAEVQPLSPSFNATTGWETKTGTYTGGDQRTNTYGGKNCWNAWWANVNASVGEQQTMAIRQKVEKLPEGLYALECKGSTQHYCLSDQHGYLVYNDQTLVTPPLTADYIDLPTVGSIWQTLTTPPVYVGEGGSVTIGFQGSKAGAVNNAYHAFGDASNTGDRREGWWCATDFRLLYHPMKKLATTAGQWGTICLPYAYSVPAGATFYQIAGVLKDHSALCLEEITTAEIAAGKPVVYKAEGGSLIFSEYGEKAKTPSSYRDENNLRGFFETTGRAPLESYVLTGDTWYKVVSTRPSLVPFAAIVYRLDGMTELDAWAGPTMALSESDPTGIDGNVCAGNAAAPDSYTLGGRRSGGQHGVVIETAGGKTRKVLRR